MISSIQTPHQAILPDGEKVDPKNIAGKVQGMFMETMLKAMEDSIGAEGGLFGNSSSAEIYRGMFREHLANALSSDLKSPLDTQIESKLNEAMPDFSLKSNGGPSDKNSGKAIHQPAKDGPGALNE